MPSGAQDGQLRRVPVSGGTATVICACPIAFGVTWTADGSILMGWGRRRAISPASASAMSLAMTLAANSRHKIPAQSPRGPFDQSILRRHTLPIRASGVAHASTLRRSGTVQMLSKSGAARLSVCVAIPLLKISGDSERSDSRDATVSTSVAAIDQFKRTDRNDCLSSSPSWQA